MHVILRVCIHAYACANGLSRAVLGPVYRRLACTLAAPAAISSHTHTHRHTHTYTHAHIHTLVGMP